MVRAKPRKPKVTPTALKAASPSAFIRNRVIGHANVRARDLVPHPQNWRRHSVPQRAAMVGLLREIGFAGEVMVRKLDDGRYQILDGHLRAETVPDMEVPVTITDLNEDEAKLFLATFDPIGMMADRNAQTLKDLVGELHVSDDDVKALLDGIMGRSANDPEVEWTGMPEFNQPDSTAFRTIAVHFYDAEGVADFTRKLGLPINEKTIYVWFPERRWVQQADKVWQAETPRDDAPDVPEA